MQDLKKYMELKKQANKAKWNIERTEHGEMSGLTNSEYNKIQHKQKSGVTRRTHSRGNLWNHNNQPIKADIPVWYK